MNAPAHPILRWLSGPAVALVGVVGVRVIAPLCEGRTQAVVLVAGYLLVPAGLFWFASRLGQRAAQRAAEAPETRG
ncbi:hypothetical protein Verru16b_01941 [Lacunisphaera limnophila]|uniref:Uncharacterized protein n=1 Tax=Lacunisphaera limnophila TaxID=1838286 RepID=A0A1D8AVG2_9BACT|nr:hypothetical protein [Lacunisphaera limnophila]AOS44872.1 hypothetical protein Verru16b_01941 [Lacunisphaera limnophila]